MVPEGLPHIFDFASHGWWLGRDRFHMLLRELILQTLLPIQQVHGYLVSDDVHRNYKPSDAPTHLRHLKDGGLGLRAGQVEASFHPKLPGRTL